jgi:hypothetical protein
MHIQQGTSPTTCTRAAYRTAIGSVFDNVTSVCIPPEVKHLHSCALDHTVVHALSSQSTSTKLTIFDIADKASVAALQESCMLRQLLNCQLVAPCETPFAILGRLHLNHQQYGSAEASSTSHRANAYRRWLRFTGCHATGRCQQRCAAEPATHCTAVGPARASRDC